MTHHPRPAGRPHGRRAAVVLAAGIALFTALLQPANAAAHPRQVGLVTFTEATYNAKKSTAGLTVTWPKTPRTTKYEVFLSRSYSMTGAKKYTTSTPRKKFTGLVRGSDYFVQVRALNNRGIGPKSQRSGHTTIRAQGKRTGPVYRVMTYNVCSALCAGWNKSRAKAAAQRVARHRPDVLMLQEAKKDAFTRAGATLPGYTFVTHSHAKQLYLRTARFAVATTPQQTPRTGDIVMGKDRYAVWVEAIDKTGGGKRVIFVSAHTSPGGTRKAANLRRAETTTLIRAVNALNTRRLPVIYGGDFNSHKNRTDDTVTPVMRKAGLTDAFDLAQKLTRQHHNSFSGFGKKPAIGVKWGDHVDHVWVNPHRTRVLRWANGAALRNGKLVRPVPSDHSPIVVDVQVN